MLTTSTSLIRIAYADDHDTVRRGVLSLLTGMGKCTCVLEANDGKELIEKLEVANEKPDVCLLDIYMPKKDGYQTLLEIKERWPEMKVLVFTGHFTDYYLVKMIRAGADGYLVKSTPPQVVEKAIVSIHETGSYYPDLASSKFAKRVKDDKIKLPKLTDKEAELMQKCCSDLSYPQIAEQMGISPKSVEYIRVGLFKKLDIHNRSGLVVFAIKSGLVEIPSNTVTKD